MQNYNSVCYLGNSFTAQTPGFVDYLHPKLEVLLQQELRKTRAGLGGVGSLAVAAMLEFLVLRHKPSLCFVDTFTGDAGGATPIHLLSDSISTIAHDLIIEGVTPIFLLIPRVDVPKEHHDEVLGIYRNLIMLKRLVVIDLVDNFKRYLQNGGSEELLRADMVHLSPLGSQIAAEIILNQIKKSADILSPPKRLSSQLVDHAPILLIAADQLFPDRVSSLFKFAFRFIEFFPGDSIEFSSDREILGVLLIADVDSGSISIHSNISSRQYQVFDQWCGKARVQALIFHQNLVGKKIGIMVPLTCVEESFDCWNRRTSIKRVAKSIKIIGFIGTSARVNFE